MLDAMWFGFNSIVFAVFSARWRARHTLTRNGYILQHFRIQIVYYVGAQRGAMNLIAFADLIRD